MFNEQEEHASPLPPAVQLLQKAYVWCHFFFFLGPLQILMNARRGGTPVPTTRCALTWTEATTAAVPTDTTAPGTASTTARSSTAGRSGCWTTIAALSAPVR